MRYIEPLLGFLAFLWFLMASLLAFRRHRDWRGKAQILLGLCGLAFFGLILNGRFPSRTHIFERTFERLETLFAGISLGVFVTLWLEGCLNILARIKGRGPRPNQNRT